MIYILAGADGTGKSTLFKGLKDKLSGAVFIKESYTPDIEERHLRVARFQELLKSGKTVIYDRATILDDLVYCPVIDHKESSLRTPFVAGLLSDATVIYLQGNVELIKDRLNARGDEYVNGDNVHQILNGYEEAFIDMNVVPYRLNAHLTADKLLVHALQIINRKNFKVAHIVPVGSLSKTNDCVYNMCLANVAIKDHSYAEYFRQKSVMGQFVLMDNGAAEGDQLDMNDLIRCYHYVEPNEVVLPDTLLDGNDTIEKSEVAIRKLHSHYGSELPFTLMAVPQGRNLDEWSECAREFVKNPEIKSLGVSKFLQMETHDPFVRGRAVKELGKLLRYYNRYDMEVHLLGLSENPCIVKTIQNKYPFVRGCDSAYAYICTQVGIPIFSTTARPAGEIDFIGGQDYEKLANNLQALELAEGCYDNQIDSTWADNFYIGTY